jgi:hypothetical protein
LVARACPLERRRAEQAADMIGAVGGSLLHGSVLLARR